MKGLGRSFLLFATSTSITALAAPIEEIEVSGRKINLVGSATSASEGRISYAELALRPLLRTGEVLESVPGLVATQHSGSGKANQFFLRGFNLDHGTDFATYVDNMPVNMRTHGHGQGYTDLNFLIPELIEEISFRKGSYYADAGDFSGTGSARITTTQHNTANSLSAAAGTFGYQRVLLSGSAAVNGDKLIYGAEQQRYDGPWDQIDEDVGKTNLLLKYRSESANDQFELTFMGYNNEWNAADQIPQRAVDSGVITDFGSIDTTVGGESSRYSLSANWTHTLGAGQLRASAYMIDYDMSLYSNFSYFTNLVGDQFQQIDQRKIYGGNVEWQQDNMWGSVMSTNVFGAQLRVDDIAKVGLISTAQREFLGDIRLDSVDEWSGSVYWQNTLHWTPQLRTVAGMRYDYFDFAVNALSAADLSTLEPNSGYQDADITTASASIIYSISDNIEVYASIGQGFHSNDARGTTISQDPVTAESVQPVDPLVDTLGSELGARVFITDRLNASIAIWQLDIDSELLFVGDAGNTEDTGVASERSGVEVTGYYQMNDALSFDLEYSYTESRFDVPQATTDVIPGALPHVFSGGVNLKLRDNFNAYLHARHFADYPLDGGESAKGSTLVNLRVGYDFTPRLSMNLDILNLLDSDDHDVEYFYESQLANEIAPVADKHFHVFEPRSFRVYANYNF
ncbi:MAG: TonB-dependent receptor [Pseudomonadota bacterium]